MLFQLETESINTLPWEMDLLVVMTLENTWKWKSDRGIVPYRFVPLTFMEPLATTC